MFISRGLTCQSYDGYGMRQSYDFCGNQQAPLGVHQTPMGGLVLFGNNFKLAERPPPPPKPLPVMCSQIILKPRIIEKKNVLKYRIVIQSNQRDDKREIRPDFGVNSLSLPLGAANGNLVVDDHKEVGKTAVTSLPAKKILIKRNKTRRLSVLPLVKPTTPTPDSESEEDSYPIKTPVQIAEGDGFSFQRKTIERIKRAARELDKEMRLKAEARRSQEAEMVELEKQKERAVEAFRRQVAKRLQPPKCPNSKRSRIAIVGAGPTGLWLALILARKYCTFARGADGSRTIIRGASAPIIDVVERRQLTGAGELSYGSRKIILAISSQTQDLLNGQLGANYAFSPTTSINTIESALRDVFGQFVNAGVGKMRFGVETNDPDSLHAEGYDAVVIASGRNGVTAEWRAQRDMEVAVSTSETAIIVAYTKATGGIRGKAAADIALARVGAGSARMFLRPGIIDADGWLWMLDLNKRIIKAAKRILSERAGSNVDAGAQSRSIDESVVKSGTLGVGSGDCAESPVFPSFLAMGKAICLDTLDALEEVLQSLDEALQPGEVTLRITKAAHWRANEVVRTTSDGITLLIGDAACGRPFYLGSNLNWHFADIFNLTRVETWDSRDPDVNMKQFKCYRDTIMDRNSSAGKILKSPKKKKAEVSPDLDEDEISDSKENS
jgi:hypothetical protein